MEFSLCLSLEWLRSAYGLVRIQPKLKFDALEGSMDAPYDRTRLCVNGLFGLHLNQGIQSSNPCLPAMLNVFGGQEFLYCPNFSHNSSLHGGSDP